MELAVHKNSVADSCDGKSNSRQNLGGAGEYGLGARLIAVQILGQFEDTVEVSRAQPFLPLLLGLAQCVANQVLDENRLFPVGFVLRSAWLEIEAERASLISSVRN